MEGPGTKRRWIFDSLSCYWRRAPDAVGLLPLLRIEPSTSEELPPPLMTVRLPDWAADVGVGGSLVVPSKFLVSGQEPPWQRIDWIAAAAWFLDGSAERAFESAHGPIHSYAFRLRGWDARIWDHAWVNRIALFLRRWTARVRGQSEASLFGPLGEARIVLTHDVDAVRKTAAVRLKQSAFHLVNSARHAAGGRIITALGAAARAATFAVSRGDYWCFDEIRRLENEHGLTSHFNVYACPDGRRRGPKQTLLDPAYSVREPRLRENLRALHRAGWTIGLHQSFDAWADAQRMAQERRALEEALGVGVRSCRQHWLRFSWNATWAAQQQAGLELDMTLGFNDRPGFRNGAALAHHPWDAHGRKPMRMQAVPMMLMDSHLYDYRALSDGERQREVARWIDEVRAVRGTASIIWHQRVMSEDYGWGEGYRRLISDVARRAA